MTPTEEKLLKLLAQAVEYAENVQELESEGLFDDLEETEKPIADFYQSAIEILNTAYPVKGSVGPLDDPP